ncbi:hypothetical protein LO762_05830 [Actinocorallia sp. API 0066]|uniref:hypothetical protein n=1 Tax=Actinocorallia sp. API 0066 TaxID=2896846 RepID=UPI001E6209C5|nr:hypothetical protein [Actinocorallia sp. API 0066]MCD0448715.1 hypothetical protein [Actinocorallia sp. API 0066]
MSFDDDYRKRVLDPARAAGDQPPEDLRARYALPEHLTPESVAARVREVRQCWRRSRGQLKYRRLIDRLEADHRRLAGVFTAAEQGDLAPLKQHLRGGDERNAQRRADARLRLLDAAGPLKLLTPGECEAIGKAGGVSAAELNQLLRIDGVEVRPPDPLPSAPPYPGYPKARESLQVLGSRHLLAFLLGSDRIGGVRLLDGVSAGGLPIDSTGAGRALERVAGEWARRPRDTSATHAETVLIALRAALREGFLPELLRYDFVARLRERRAQRASDNALMDLAVRGLGIEPGEARRLVFAILREGGAPSGPGGRLRELLDAGQAHAASLLAGSLPDAEELAEAVEARSRVASAERLVTEAEALAARGDADGAWRLLQDATALAADLPGLAERQRALPPLPPTDVRATADGSSVRITFTPSASRSGDVAHTVVRRAGRPPADVTDGEAVAAADLAPPVNVPLHYAVFAKRGDAASPPAVAVPLLLRPEPSGIELAAGDGMVTGRWLCPPGAARVAVFRDGVPIPVGREGFTDRAVANGATLRYTVHAVYPDGPVEATTPGVTLSVTPHALPEPVTEFTLEPHGQDRILLRFPLPDHGLVEARLLDADPPWPPGALVPVAELRGVRVDSTPHARGLVVRPGASGVLLLVTLAGESAAIGAHRRHVDLPVPEGLSVTRLGGEVRVGFAWPGDASGVAVTYEIDDLGAQRVSVTRAAYTASGGVHLPVPEGSAVKVSVAGASDHGATVLTGPAATAALAARTVVRYDLAASGPPWKREIVVTLTPDRPVRLDRLDLVLRDGKVMPQRPGDGENLVSWHDLDLTAQTVVRVPLPRRRGPYWLRCFTGDAVELADPPVRRLQQGAQR